jgi:hypothetical protein
MNISIIGAGAIGSAIARALSRSDIDVSIANSRGPASLAGLAAELGPRIKPVTVREAAQADLVFLAVNWSKIPAALDGLGPWNGRILVDANNPIEAPAFRAIDLGALSSSEAVAGLAPGARVVKGFNHLQPALLAGDPRAEGGKRVLFLAGDDRQAKDEVARLAEQLGFGAIDLGSLAMGGRLTQFPGGALTALNLVKFG